MDWLDLLAVQGTLKNLIQHHSSKASNLQHSAFFTVQFSHPYMTTGKIIALTRRTFVDKVMSLLFNMLSRLVITFLWRIALAHIWGWSKSSFGFLCFYGKTQMNFLANPTEFLIDRFFFSPPFQHFECIIPFCLLWFLMRSRLLILLRLLHM